MSHNKLITDYYDQRSMTPPPTEPTALAEWVGRNASVTARVIKANPEEHGVVTYPPKLAARLLYKYAEGLAFLHKANVDKNKEASFVQMVRVEAFQEILSEMGISDTEFVLDAFKRIPGFKYEVSKGRRMF